MARLDLLLRRQRPIVLDGGWGTELQKRGLAIGQSADSWNLRRPEDVRAVARSYVEAGAEIVLTNTFQANAISLGRFGLASETERINAAGARLSREACSGTGVLVFGSIGPVGLPKSGDETRREVERRVAEAYSVQANVLAAGSIDAIVLETFCDLVEAQIAARAAMATGLPVIASFYFAMPTGSPTTPCGTTPESVAREMEAEGVDAVGANCGSGIAEFADTCRRLASASSLPVWIKPNAGLPSLSAGRAVYSTSPSEFASFVPGLVEAGAGFIGGCCGAGPEFVVAVRAALGRPIDPSARQWDESQR